MIPAYNKRYAAVPFETGIHFRRKTDFFPEEDTTKSYSGFEPKPTRLQAEDSSTDAQSHLGMPNRRNKFPKKGNGPSEGLFAGTPVQP
ncbi:hypothetical protein TNCV_2098191 [Trichonephila clavipes]|nr:hypothetical protein TNCV_2098191 [Trichonephila clavipes]